MKLKGRIEKVIFCNWENKFNEQDNVLLHPHLLGKGSVHGLFDRMSILAGPSREGSGAPS